MKIKNLSIVAIIAPVLLCNLSVNAETMETCPSVELIKKCENRNSIECIVHEKFWKIVNNISGKDEKHKLRMEPANKNGGQYARG